MKASSHPAFFPTLPVELIEIIAEFLDSNGLLRLRLTCRELNEKTFNYVTHRLFSRIWTDFSEQSLARINALCQHPRHYVQGLAIVLHTEIGHGLDWNRHPWGPLSAPMDIEPLRRLRDNLFHSLINCRSFYVYCEYPEGQAGFDRMTVTDALAVFFALVVEAKVPVSSFHLIYATKTSRTALDMRRLPKLLYRQPAFKMSWAGLQNLKLELYLTRESFGFVLELVLSASNLQTLALNLGQHNLLACEFMHELAESGTLSRLQEIDLFKTLVRARDLIKILSGTRKTLAGLALRHVVLTGDDVWSSVFTELPSDYVVLRKVILQYLYTMSPSKGPWYFPDLDKDPILSKTRGQCLRMEYAEKDDQRPSALGVNYDGSNASQLLRLLHATAVET